MATRLEQLVGRRAAASAEVADHRRAIREARRELRRSETAKAAQRVLKRRDLEVVLIAYGLAGYDAEAAAAYLTALGRRRAWPDRIQHELALMAEDAFLAVDLDEFVALTDTDAPAAFKSLRIAIDYVEQWLVASWARRIISPRASRRPRQPFWIRLRRFSSVGQKSCALHGAARLASLGHVHGSGAGVRVGAGTLAHPVCASRLRWQRRTRRQRLSTACFGEWGCVRHSHIFPGKGVALRTRVRFSVMMWAQLPTPNCSHHGPQTGSDPRPQRRVGFAASGSGLRPRYGDVFRPQNGGVFWPWAWWHCILRVGKPKRNVCKAPAWRQKAFPAWDRIPSLVWARFCGIVLGPRVRASRPGTGRRLGRFTCKARFYSWWWPDTLTHDACCRQLASFRHVLRGSGGITT